MWMWETICPYPNLFLTLVPGPVAFCCHEKESISRAVDVQLKFWATESQNSAHDRDILNSHGPYWSYNGFVFFLDCFLGISIKSPYTSVLSLPLALALPLCLFGILGGGEGGGIGDSEWENVGGSELGICIGWVAAWWCGCLTDVQHWGITGGGLDFTLMIAGGVRTWAMGIGVNCCSLWKELGPVKHGAGVSRSNDTYGISMNQSWTDTSGIGGNTLSTSGYHQGSK